MFSIYHFYKSLIILRKNFLKVEKLENFPFNKTLFSSESKGKFPDLSIRLNSDFTSFTGGELIELKDNISYSVSSFNSTIPTGTKAISSIVQSKDSFIRQQMEASGDNLYSLPIRDVFYLVRGKNKTGKQKIILTHGSFFETIAKKDLISQSFLQVLEERLKQKNINLDINIKELLTTLFSQQENFSKVRNIDKASVKLRFRIMTEVKAEGNILNSKKYPQILDNTLNFVLPYHKEQDKVIIEKKMKNVFSEKELQGIKQLIIKHHLNGYFLVFQKKI